MCVQDIARKPHVCCQGVKIRTSIIIVDDDDDKNSEDVNIEDVVGDCNSDDDDDVGQASLLQRGALEAPAGVPDMLRILLLNI